MAHTRRNLRTGAIVETIARLGQRIEARFPGSGLREVAAELLTVAEEVQQRAATIARPQLALRVATLTAVGALLVALAIGVFSTRVQDEPFMLSQLVALTEAGINVLVVVGGGILFLATAEQRVRRRRALTAIHELREIAHVVDMHQLAKDPQRVLHRGKDWTSASPVNALDRFGLSRYLDYCSEMFSLIGKLAAVYSKNLDDPEVVSAANDVEALTTGLSRKVWQKLMVLESGIHDESDRDAVGAPGA